MNSENRHAINVRNMLNRKYHKCKTKNNQNAFKKQRNCVNNSAIQLSLLYLIKQKNNNTNILLLEDNKIVNQPLDVANVFNEYYVNVTKEIGDVGTIFEHYVIESILQTHKKHDATI